MDYRMNLSFTIQGAPISINALYYNWGRRARILSNEGGEFKRKVRFLALEAMNRKKIRVLTVPVSITIRYYFQTRRGDVDNCTKAILDALEGVIYKNDSQVGDNSIPNEFCYEYGLHCFKFKDKARPRTEVSIEWY